MPYTVFWRNQLGSDHCQTLTNLVAGLTDRSSANRLGVSERTVQRRVRELMDWSASGNRMQLGHRAALAGLPERHSHPHSYHLPHPVPTTAARTPDADALRLLRLLLDDAAADRMLNLSTSSIERRVRELMTLAEARSRAQLGWLATRWGWL